MARTNLAVAIQQASQPEPWIVEAADEACRLEQASKDARAAWEAHKDSLRALAEHMSLRIGRLVEYQGTLGRVVVQMINARKAIDPQLARGACDVLGDDIAARCLRVGVKLTIAKGVDHAALAAQLAAAGLEDLFEYEERVECDPEAAAGLAVDGSLTHQQRSVCEELARAARPEPRVSVKRGGSR